MVNLKDRNCLSTFTSEGLSLVWIPLISKAISIQNNTRKRGKTMDKLLQLLTKNQVDYEIIKHNKQINTAQEGAEYFGIQIGQAAPTLILNTDKGYYSLIISGDYGRVDLHSMKELLGVQKIKLAKSEEVERVTGSTIGSVSLINIGLPTIMDRELYRFSYVYGGTGMPQTTLKISPRDIENLNEVIEYLR
jgi:prolyl-tRNA editing enzyme YbaK/EbsC (Cys-tRNA(Pro) deacylase)